MTVHEDIKDFILKRNWISNFMADLDANHYRENSSIQL